MGSSVMRGSIHNEHTLTLSHNPRPLDATDGPEFGTKPPGQQCWGANFCGAKNLLDYACLQASPCTGDGFMALNSVSINFNAGNQGLVDQLIGGINLAEEAGPEHAAAIARGSGRGVGGGDGGARKARSPEEESEIEEEKDFCKAEIAAVESERDNCAARAAKVRMKRNKAREGGWGGGGGRHVSYLCLRQ